MSSGCPVPSFAWAGGVVWLFSVLGTRNFAQSGAHTPARVTLLRALRVLCGYLGFLRDLCGFSLRPLRLKAFLEFVIWIRTRNSLV